MKVARVLKTDGEGESALWWTQSAFLQGSKVYLLWHIVAVIVRAWWAEQGTVTFLTENKENRSVVFICVWWGWCDKEKEKEITCSAFPRKTYEFRWVKQFLCRESVRNRKKNLQGSTLGSASCDTFWMKFHKGLSPVPSCKWVTGCLGFAAAFAGDSAVERCDSALLVALLKVSHYKCLLTWEKTERRQSKTSRNNSN